MSMMPKRLRNLTYSFPGIALKLMEQHPRKSGEDLYWPEIDDLHTMLLEHDLPDEITHALRFLLDIWDGSGEFKIHEAFRCWDEQYRWIFLLWATGQDEQPDNRPSPWVPVQNPPWLPKHTVQ